MAFYIGLDLGGTNIKAGVVDDRKRVLARGSTHTPAEAGPTAVVEAMHRAAERVAADAGLRLADAAGIGIGAPGMLDLRAGVVRAAPNLAGWRDVPLLAEITRRTDRPAVLENDANAAAFGEFWAGAGRDESIRHLAMFTLGTGIGSGLIVDGRVVHGEHTLAGEAGHMIVQPGGRRCACGQRGCLEAYASATNTARRATEALAAGEPSKLGEAFRDRADTMTTKDVFDAAQAGDALAGRIVDETAWYLGVACINLCRVLDPQMIVFAGGMILAGDWFFEKVRQVFAAENWRVLDTPVPIVPAELGNDAGFIGAAAVAWDAAQRGKLG